VKSANSGYDEITFAASDGYALTGHCYTPATEPHTLLLLNSGTGIPQGFYAKFASFAAENGFAVLTFDYRGVGKSAPSSLVGFQATYREWGQLDVSGAISWFREQFPKKPLTVVGHSTGGQQLGLAHNLDAVSAAVFVAVGTGYWKKMFPVSKWLSLFVWHVYVPVATKLLGYAPMKKLGMGENLPSGVALEWGSWCLQPEYLAAFFDNTGSRQSVNGKAFGATHFEQANFPVKAYCFTDDHIATPNNVATLMALFAAAVQDINWVEPSQQNAKHIGHFNFFRPHVGKNMWREALTWLQQQAS